MKEDKLFDLTMNIKKITLLQSKRRNRHLKELDLSAEQSAALLFIDQAENPTIKDLADYLGVQHQSAAGIIKRMKEKGLVSLEKLETDGRARKLSLTEEGEKKKERIQKNGEGTGTIFVDGMSEGEQELFFALIEKALRNLEQAEQQEKSSIKKEVE